MRAEAICPKVYGAELPGLEIPHMSLSQRRSYSREQSVPVASRVAIVSRRSVAIEQVPAE
jgi:hypothetical protein